MKPGIVRANVMTAAAGFMFASAGHIDLGKFLALIVGNALVIGSACVFNNIMDRGIDARMKRTSKRALVTGKISVRAAATYGSILLVIGSALLWQYTNLITMLIGWWAVFMYVVVYGYAKRETSYGTEVGSLPGAASIIAGYAAVTAHINEAGLILFLSMIFWQMPHFFAIAIFRAKDYAAAKIPVLPLKKGIPETKLRMLGYTVLFGITSMSLYFLNHASLTYGIVMGIISAYWLFVGLRGLNTADPEKWARKMFGVSLIVLMVFSAAIAFDYWLP